MLPHQIASALSETTEFLKKYTTGTEAIGIVLGTGLGALVEHMQVIHRVAYSEIPHFPVATVEFHKGQLLFGMLGGRPVIVMQGRFHFYEGYTMAEITFPIRVLGALGCTQLLLSNAAGGIRADLKKGDLVLLDDHINLQTDNPLRGVNDPVLGVRFVDMSAPYNANMQQALRETAVGKGVEMKTGVYAAVIGPNLETRAEYRYLRTIGADVVGMSTVPEVIVAGQIGLPCVAISVITDECNPDNLKPVQIEEILAVAGKADEKLSAIVAEAVGKM
jgi:purine-nucleoside phosphorylase